VALEVTPITYGVLATFQLPHHADGKGAEVTPSSSPTQVAPKPTRVPTAAPVPAAAPEVPSTPVAPTASTPEGEYIVYVTAPRRLCTRQWLYNHKHTPQVACWCVTNMTGLAQHRLQMLLKSPCICIAFVPHPFR
jgi:hypothetical protein